MDSTNKQTKVSKNWLLLTVPFMIPLLIFIGVITLSAHLRSQRESDFAYFVKSTIVGDAKPEVWWVDNTTSASASYNLKVAEFRKIIQDNKYTDVSPYAKCQIIKNALRYDTIGSSEYCVAQLCNQASSCVYIFAYSGGYKNITIKSLRLFNSKTLADKEISALLSQ